MKFGTLIAKGIPKRFGCGGILNFQHGAHGSRFSKWLPTTTVFSWVMDILSYLPYIALGKCLLDSWKTVIEYSRWLPFFKMATVACMTDMGVKSVGLYFLWSRILIWNIVIGQNLPSTFQLCMTTETARNTIMPTVIYFIAI